MTITRNRLKKKLLLIILLVVSFSAYAQEEKEPFMEEIYFTNANGERITGSVSLSDEFVYLNIVSTNAIGEKVVLTMDEDEEYLYKKKFLAGGSSVKFLIKEDLQKVKLTIYNPNKKKHVKRRMKSLGYSAAEDVKE